MSAALTPVAEALNRILSLAEPLSDETVSLMQAAGRALRREVRAGHAQPPFDAAQMDGYVVALPGGETAAAGAGFSLVGEARAGAGVAATLAAGEAARIFTGAPTPAAAPGSRLALALQEDAEVDAAAGQVRFREPIEAGRWIRPAGLDFSEGDLLLSAPRRLSAEDVALAAAGGAPWLTVARRPRVALLPLGDELKLPGEPLAAAQIHASNQFGVGALLAEAGATVSLSPVVPDTLDALRGAIRGAAGSDVIVTLGGASDGAHDLARPAFAAEGMTPDFYKIAMRPGKPLMAGRLGGALVLGLPGNPVSALVCARVFLLPALAALEGAPDRAETWVDLPLAAPVEAGGPRAHYMRARIDGVGADRAVRAFDDQDSSRLKLLSDADCLLLRPIDDPPRATGDRVPCLLMR